MLTRLQDNSRILDIQPCYKLVMILVKALLLGEGIMLQGKAPRASPLKCLLASNWISITEGFRSCQVRKKPTAAQSSDFDFILAQLSQHTLDIQERYQLDSTCF